jgi:hypothetical protein
MFFVVQRSEEETMKNICSILIHNDGMIKIMQSYLYAFCIKRWFILWQSNEVFIYLQFHNNVYRMETDAKQENAFISWHSVSLCLQFMLFQ